MKQFDWLYFTKAERRGIFVLAALILLFTVLPRFYSYLIPEKDYSTEIQTQFEQFTSAQNMADSLAVIERENNKQQPYVAKRSTYERNTVSRQNKEKINNAEVERKPYQKTPYAPKKVPKVININTANAEDFATLPGIGEVFSTRIIKYRNALGGFASVEQVSSTYGLETEVFERIKPYLSISQNYQTKRLNINTATQAELESHPYISPKLASQMINFREKVHPFSTKDDVKKLYFMTDELLQKLEPYISFE